LFFFGKTAIQSSLLRVLIRLFAWGRIAVDFLWFLLIGLAAGWLASQIMKGGGSGLVSDLVMGVIGSMLGGFLFGLLGLSATGAFGNLVTATVGAIVLIAGLRAINRPRI
jgi:uncharacterized membrane protein YeaQ/YmgE (transglycosylase-associated protein family)